MDTYSVLLAYTSQTTLNSDLAVRYTGGGCGTFNTELSNVWVNFYNKKKTVISPVSARVATAQTSVGHVNTNLTNIASVFTSAATNLNSVAATVTNPTYGMIAGLNCRVFG